MFVVRLWPIVPCAYGQHPIKFVVKWSVPACSVTPDQNCFPSSCELLLFTRPASGHFPTTLKLRFQRLWLLLEISSTLAWRHFIGNLGKQLVSGSAAALRPTTLWRPPLPSLHDPHNKAVLTLLVNLWGWWWFIHPGAYLRAPEVLSVPDQHWDVITVGTEHKQSLEGGAAVSAFRYRCVY